MKSVLFHILIAHSTMSSLANETLRDVSGENEKQMSVASMRELMIKFTTVDEVQGRKKKPMVNSTPFELLTPPGARQRFRKLFGNYFVWCRLKECWVTKSPKVIPHPKQVIRLQSELQELIKANKKTAKAARTEASRCEAAVKLKVDEAIDEATGFQEMEKQIPLPPSNLCVRFHMGRLLNSLNGGLSGNKQYVYSYAELRARCVINILMIPINMGLLTKDDIIVDIGSGINGPAWHAAQLINCRAFGIEVIKERHQCALVAGKNILEDRRSLPVVGHRVAALNLDAAGCFDFGDATWAYIYDEA